MIRKQYTKDGFPRQAPRGAFHRKAQRPLPPLTQGRVAAVSLKEHREEE